MRTARFLVLSLFFFLIVHVAQAGYYDPSFTLQDESQCVGGTLLQTYYDVADTGASADAKLEAKDSCQMLMTGPGQCCDVDYRRSSPPAPAIGEHFWAYNVYEGATIGPEQSPSGANTLANSTFQRWAGISGNGTVQATMVANPTSIFLGEQSLLSWSSTGATSCAGTNFDTGGAPSGSLLVTPEVTTLYSVTCTGAQGSATAHATVLVDDGGLQVSCHGHPLRASVGEDVLWSSTVSGGAGTYSYFWTGTDGLTGTGNQVFKQYSTQGSKTASLTVTFTPSPQASASKAVFSFLTSWLVPRSAEAAQCLQGQTATPVFTPEGASCVGGTLVGKTSDVLDGAQIGLFPDGWLANTCSELGAVEGDCCELAMRASNAIGNGFPASSYWQVRVVRDATISTVDATYIQTAQCSGKTLDYSCSSVAGFMGTSCSGSGGGGGGSISKTVLCDNPVLVGPPQCSDGIDNDGDGLADAQDPGCTTGGGGGGGGGGAYDPNGNNESGTGTGGGAIECADGRDNNGDGNIDWPDDPGCSSATDSIEAVVPADLSLSVNPPLIKKDQQCTLTFSARNVVNCALTGVGVSKTYTATNGFVTTKEVVTPGLAQTATYTLSCTGLDGKTATKKVDCKIAPTFEEI